LQLRERLALTQSVVGGFLQEVAEHAEVHEAVVISTCNHTELSLVVGGSGARRERRAGDARPAGARGPTALAERIDSPHKQ